MIILLDSESKIGRVAVAEQAVADAPGWTHLALEVISEAIPEGEDVDFHVEVVQRCAAELAKENMHLFLTLPNDVEQQKLLATGLQPNCITIHLGGGKAEDYDHIIDPATHSVKDILDLVQTIIKDVA